MTAKRHSAAKSERPPAAFDEMKGFDGDVRPSYRALAKWLGNQDEERLETLRREADVLFRRMGITFAVYHEGAGTERLIPFDILPRVFSAAEWRKVSEGAIQRTTALNAFLADVYGGREILKAGKIPERLVLGNSLYRKEMEGLELPGDVYVNIAGIDIVRVDAETFYVLEDNLRTPSGVSYMLENRNVMMRLMPELFAMRKVAPVDHYPDVLLHNLRGAAHPAAGSDPTVVLLTPGRFNSAYFEHAFLAEQMGIELVEGHDLFVRDDMVYMRTSEGPKRVDVIYRRLDDDFLDPQAFRADSAIGVPGLLRAYRKRKVALANAIGTGVADDKAVYSYVPEMIRFYLGQEPILQNVPTWRLGEPDDLKYVLEHLGELVVKEVHGSGGYGMLVGPKAAKAEIAAYRKRVLADPGNFIAQPTLALSTTPTFVDEGVAPRHVDLRPFVLSSAEQVTLVPGGLTRVALRRGSLVVNSSQGGGTKDTWVLEA
jgi:uncharacterized circularly permuted ATP-grasp superfamily protein